MNINIIISIIIAMAATSIPKREMPLKQGQLSRCAI